MRDSLGWAVLLLGLAAAILPYLAAATLNSLTRTAFTFIALGVGTIILLYLLTSSVRNVSEGIILAMAGYAAEIAGAVKERNAG